MNSAGDTARDQTATMGLGLSGVFAASLMEKYVPIVPSYVMLMLIGMTAADLSSLSVLVVVTVTGSLCASLGWVAIGRALGERRVERIVRQWGGFVFFRLEAYSSLASSYRRNRFWVTLLGQTLPVARVYLGLPAGVLKLRTSTFLILALLGILLWNVPFLTLGYALRGSTGSSAHVGMWTSVGLICAEVAILVALAAVRRFRHGAGGTTK